MLSVYIYAFLYLRWIIQSFFLIRGTEGLLDKQAVSGSCRKATGLHHMRSGYFRRQQMETAPKIQWEESFKETQKEKYATTQEKRKRIKQICVWVSTVCLQAQFREAQLMLNNCHMRLHRMNLNTSLIHADLHKI